jgi:hypothetical protein
MGGCTLLTCQQAPSFGDDAGTLTISGGSIPVATTVANQGNGAYSYSAIGPDFAAGTTLTVSGTGGMVPAFGSQSVTAPPFVTLTAPMVDDAGTSTVSTSADLVVTWSGGVSGATMSLQLGADLTFSSITCMWDASLGQGTVPQALLGSMAGAGQGYVEYGQANVNTFTSGAYSIEESAMLYSLGTVQLQ